MKYLVTCLVLLALAGCATSGVPASGETADGEKFTGTFSRWTDTSGGTVTLQSEKGAQCEGRWLLDGSTGSTIVTCSDGRTGTAELSMEEPGGTMKGMLGGKYFHGVFENPTLPPAR